MRAKQISEQDKEKKHKKLYKLREPYIILVRRVNLFEIKIEKFLSQKYEFQK